VEDLVIVHLEATFMQDEGPQAVLKWLRQNFQGTLIAAGGFTKASAELALIEGYLDLVALARPSFLTLIWWLASRMTAR
jgi:2,4-dienoyl-CoA reductase-like NADH-dependent reductase (Old Yellow Enzyme family)